METDAFNSSKCYILIRSWMLALTRTDNDAVNVLLYTTQQRSLAIVVCVYKTTMSKTG